MPQTQDSTEHHIHLAVGQFLHCFGILEKIDQLFIYSESLSTGIFIEGAKVIHAGIFMINIKEPVIFFQQKRCFGRTVIKPFCRIARIIIDVGDCIEIGEINLPFRLNYFRFLDRSAASCQNQ